MSTIHFRIDDEIKRLAVQAAEVSLTEVMRQRAEKLAAEERQYQETGLLIANGTDDKFVSMVSIFRENLPVGTKAGRTEDSVKGWFRAFLSLSGMWLRIPRSISCGCCTHPGR
ncbi:MAG: hypothetical protein ACOH2G_03410 [Ewingella sp.]